MQLPNRKKEFKNNIFNFTYCYVENSKSHKFVKLEN